jgi:hypothetical protein
VVTVESYFKVVQSVPIGSAAQDWCSIARGLQPHSQLRTTLLQQTERAIARPSCSIGTCRRHRRSLKLQWLHYPELLISTALQGYECLGKHRT